MNKDARKYYNQVKLLFPEFTRESRKYIKYFKENIKEFNSANPSANYDDFVNNFGEPKDISVAYYKDMDYKTYNKILSKKRFVNLLLTLLFICAIINFFIIHYLYVYLDNSSNNYISNYDPQNVYHKTIYVGDDADLSFSH